MSLLHFSSDPDVQIKNNYVKMGISQAFHKRITLKKSVYPPVVVFSIVKVKNVIFSPKFKSQNRSFSPKVENSTCRQIFSSKGLLDTIEL